MKKQIILTTAIVFVVMYLFNGFIELEFDFRCWSKNNRLGYLFFSSLFSIMISVMGVVNSNLD